MNRRNRQILTLLLCALMLQWLIVINAPAVALLADGIQGSILVLYRSVFPKSTFTIIGTVERREHTAVYRNLPPGFIHCGRTLLFQAPRDMRLREIADSALRFTHFFRRYQLERTIKEYNGFRSDSVGKGTVVYIPYSIAPRIPALRRTAKPAIIDSRGLYYTGGAIASEKTLSSLERFLEAGINTVVFDAKDITGIVNYRSHVPAAIEFNTHARRCIDDVDKLIRHLKEKGVYVIGRIAVFHDHALYRAKPEFAIRSKSSGKPWSAGAELWCDPTNKHVQDYNIALAIELAEKGVDEIQFDYIRFPTSGNLGDAAFAYHFGAMPKEATITNFLKRAHAELSPRHVNLSVDIFGVVAWGKEVDIRRTGQRIEQMAKHCEVISPMLYPSHFNDDFDGFAKPGDQPYYFINRGCARVRALAPQTTVRPWLQAFRWRTKSYNDDYILEQVRGAVEAGAKGYLFWNASNSYDPVYAAMRRLADEKRKYAEKGHGQ